MHFHWTKTREYRSISLCVSLDGRPPRFPQREKLQKKNVFSVVCHVTKKYITLLLTWFWSVFFTSVVEWHSCTPFFSLHFSSQGSINLNRATSRKPSDICHFCCTRSWLHYNPFPHPVHWRPACQRSSSDSRTRRQTRINFSIGMVFRNFKATTMKPNFSLLF